MPERVGNNFASALTQSFRQTCSTFERTLFGVRASSRLFSFSSSWGAGPVRLLSSRSSEDKDRAESTHLIDLR